MNDGFQSAYPREAATIAGGARASGGLPSPEADVDAAALPRRRDSRAPAPPAFAVEPALPRWRSEREAAAHDPGDPLIHELTATVHGLSLIHI